MRMMLLWFEKLAVHKIFMLINKNQRENRLDTFGDRRSVVGKYENWNDERSIDTSS